MDNQDFFLKRFRGISQTPCGENVDLTEAYMKLVESGLVERSPRLVIRWRSSGRSDMRIGHSSLLMKTVLMNPKLDTEDVSENALDYALHPQICHVNLGFRPTRENDSGRYETMPDRYPDRATAETELMGLGIGS